MTRNSEATIARLGERCETSEGMTEADANTILEAHRTIELLGRNTVSVAHHTNVLMRVCKLGTEVGRPTDTLDDRAAAEPLVRYINRAYENPETNKGFRTDCGASGGSRPAAGTSRSVVRRWSSHAMGTAASTTTHFTRST